MYRHISLYTFDENPANGKTKEENMRQFQGMLEKLPEIEPSIVNSVVGVGLGGPPDMAGFYEMAQIIDFETREACMAYPASKGHLDLVAFGDTVIKSVSIIDFEM